LKTDRFPGFVADWFLSVLKTEAIYCCLAVAENINPMHVSEKLPSENITMLG
jgi:hypothetical protein